MFRRVLAGFCLFAAIARGAAGQPPELLAPLERAIAAAEESLRGGERQIAESRYRTALLQGWMLLGALHARAGRLADARTAFEHASSSAVENRAALQSLAVVQLQLGEFNPALEILAGMAFKFPRDVPIRRVFAQALVAAGKPSEAVQELEEAYGAVPEDAELAFALASGYLRIKKVEQAERLFGTVAAARPLSQTYVLIGRTYRDFGYYDRARAALQHALKLDPRTGRAHYYLGTIAVMSDGLVGLDEAISEFQRELKIAPGDSLAAGRLGMALVEARRYVEALPLLEGTVRAPAPSSDAWLYLGRCYLALDRPTDSITALRRALETSPPPESASAALDQSRLRTIHYQLGTALRQTGAAAEAERAFAEAQRLSAKRTDADREGLAQYLADARDPVSLNAPVGLDVGELAMLSEKQRGEIEQRAHAALARAYLNLGIMQAQGSRFTRAAELFEQAAAIDPLFPQVQYSLGVAYFNAQQYAKAAASLGRVIEKEPQNTAARRMLALASLNADDYSTAVQLLRDDPNRASDPSLQYAYGVSLVRSNHAADAEQIFSRLLAEHPDVPELNVVLGQAYAAQGDYERAVTALRRALSLKSGVAEANGTLGEILLKQGRLVDATEALRAELASRPADVRTRQMLATVLDLDGRTDEALAELRVVMAARPQYGDAHYLSGKILLARGLAAEALVHLETAARLAPDDANVHYQLGQAYQRTGQAELAAREFDIFQKLKNKQRGGMQ